MFTPRWRLPLDIRSPDAAQGDRGMNHTLLNPAAFVVALHIFVQEGGTESVVFSPQVLIASLYVFMLAAFLGYQVISRVPPLLHTPLMSATNAISGISLIGSIVIAGAHH